MDMFRVLIAVALATAVALRGYKKRSLNLSGAVAGWLVGFLSMLASQRFGWTLIIFFLSSSKLTKLGAKRKEKVEDGYQHGGQRNWVQVLANAGVGTALSAAWLQLFGLDSPSIDFDNHYLASVISLAYLGAYACCCGDTWSSELGVLSQGSPRLVLPPFRTVPPGTNGGVSVVGTVAAGLGGLLMGVSFYVLGLFSGGAEAAVSEWPVIPAGALAGVLGSAADSVLGATLQYSGWSEAKKKVVERPGPNVKHIVGFDVLDNHQVNFLAVLLTAAATAYAAPAFFAACLSA